MSRVERYSPQETNTFTERRYYRRPVSRQRVMERITCNKTTDARTSGHPRERRDGNRNDVPQAKRESVIPGLRALSSTCWQIDPFKSHCDCRDSTVGDADRLAKNRGADHVRRSSLLSSTRTKSIRGTTDKDTLVRRVRRKNTRSRETRQWRRWQHAL